jgi:TetR/AcrR family transcriptional regulator, transcriptional repressor for nem operon
VRAQGEGDVPPDADPIETARALLAAQQGLVFMGRTGLDIDKLTATARSLAAQLLPGT